MGPRCKVVVVTKVRFAARVQFLQGPPGGHGTDASHSTGGNGSGALVRASPPQPYSLEMDLGEKGTDMSTMSMWFSLAETQMGLP